MMCEEELIKHRIFSLLIVLLLIPACTGQFWEEETVIPIPTPTQVAVIITRIPTATNFPHVGTVTPIPPTATPTVTFTPKSQTAETLFDDETLAELMQGTIASGGLEVETEIIDNRADGGERVVHITIYSEHNADGNNLLLRVFLIEVGNALRTIRAFDGGTLNADLDSASLVVYDQGGKIMGTMKASMPEIVRFLDGKSTVDESLRELEITGIFVTFLKD